LELQLLGKLEVLHRREVPLEEAGTPQRIATNVTRVLAPGAVVCRRDYERSAVVAALLRHPVYVRDVHALVGHIVGTHWIPEESAYQRDVFRQTRTRLEDARKLPSTANEPFPRRPVVQIGEVVDQTCAEVASHINITGRPIRPGVERIREAAEYVHHVVLLMRPGVVQ